MSRVASFVLLLSLLPSVGLAEVYHGMTGRRILVPTNPSDLAAIHQNARLWNLEHRGGSHPVYHSGFSNGTGQSPAEIKPEPWLPGVPAGR
jgi:hypothetical protein